MEYNDYQYLWPPRPTRAVVREMLDSYVAKGYVGQIKKNGTNNVIFVSGDRELTCMSRHNEPHKLWTPTEKSSLAFKALPGRKWYVFCAELLHSKVVGMRDTNYIHDILVHDGEFLVGSTFMERQKLLANLFPYIETTEFYNVVNPNTWVARLIEDDFKNVFDRLTSVEDEGLVLKRAKAPLDFCFKETSNSDWLVKVRKLHKNYAF